MTRYPTPLLSSSLTAEGTLPAVRSIYSLPAESFRNYVPISIKERRSVATINEECPFGFVINGTPKKLQGGVVSGGESNIVVSDINLSSSAVSGTWLWLKVVAIANNVDDVLLAGIESITTVTSGSGTSIPDNVIPTAAAPSGTVYIPLGNYASGVFHPSGCGNFSIQHCPSNIGYSRQ